MYSLMKADVLARMSGLKQEISQLHHYSQRDQANFALLESRFSRLQSFNSEPRLQAYLSLLEQDAAVNKQIAQLRHVANAALCDYEKYRVQTLCHQSNATNDYLTRFDQALRTEIGLAEMADDARILLVGSGALPTTALTLVSTLGAKIFCYDHDPLAHQLARKLIRHLGLQEQIHCIDTLAELTPIPLSHIIISSLVPDKHELLHRVAPYITPGGKLLIRYGNGFKSTFNCPYCHEAHCPHWRITVPPVTTPLYDLIILEPNLHE